MEYLYLYRAIRNQKKFHNFTPDQNQPRVVIMTATKIVPRVVIMTATKIVPRVVIMTAIIMPTDLIVGVLIVKAYSGENRSSRGSWAKDKQWRQVVLKMEKIFIVLRHVHVGKNDKLISASADNNCLSR